MTIYFPDVSNHDSGLVIQPATVVVCAKATQGNWYKDATYANFKAQAAKVGAIFVAYHFLEAGNADSQAQFAFNVVGPDVPLMIDFEPTTNSNPTMADCLAFRTAYEKLGGKCVLVYLPHWYWQNLNSPDLKVLSPMGLVSSNYTTYSDSGPGWNSYGGVTPLIWQYTDALSYGGQSVDFNAYKGTVEQFKAFVSPSDPPPAPVPTPVPPAPTVQEDDDMPQIDSLSRNPEGQYAFAFPRGKWREVAFCIDGFGADAKLRVVVWSTSGLVVHDNYVVKKGSNVLALDDAVNAFCVTVSRVDTNKFPIGVAFS